MASSTAGKPENGGSPVKINATKSSSGWIVTINLSDPNVKEISYRTKSSAVFKSTGFLDNPVITGGKLPNPSITLPLSQKASDILIRYTMADGTTRGPFTVFFDPKTESIASAKRILGMISGDWVATQEIDGKLYLYFTMLIVYRDAIDEIRYSLDTPSLNKRFPVPKPDGKMEIPPKAKLFEQIPVTTKEVFIQLIFRDGTKSDVKSIKKHGVL